MPGGIDEQLLPYLTARHWYIAYSGGLDSSVLLHILAGFPQRPALTAVHIHHGLQADADSWQQHCQHQAAALGVDFRAIQVKVAADANVEANARAARYDALSALLQPGDCLFMAHHRDDQAETLLYRLLRGAGVRGLGAMSVTRPLALGTLVRPLLAMSRQQLLDYAHQQQLVYVDDPSNQQLQYDRNFLRHQVLPVLQQRWPAAVDNLARAAQHQQQAQSLLDEVAEEDLPALTDTALGCPRLHLLVWQQLSMARRHNALRYWLQQQGIALSAAQWQVLLDNVIDAAPDAMPQLQVAGKLLRRFDYALYLCPLTAEAGFTAFDWHTVKPCHIAGVGSFRLTQPGDLVLQVRARQGGEKIQLAGHTHQRKLKQLLQEMRVPPWQRDRLPLFFYQGKLIAVADLLVSEEAVRLLGEARISHFADAPDYARL